MYVQIDKKTYNTFPIALQKLYQSLNRSLISKLLHINTHTRDIYYFEISLHIANAFST